MRLVVRPRRFAGKTGESAEGCGDMRVVVGRGGSGGVGRWRGTGWFRRDGGDGDFIGFGGCAVGGRGGRVTGFGVQGVRIWCEG